VTAWRRDEQHVTGMDSTLAEHMATMDPSLLAGSLQAYKSSSNRASVGFLTDRTGAVQNNVRAALTD
jgi:hypothetical protein